MPFELSLTPRSLATLALAALGSLGTGCSEEKGPDAPSSDPGSSRRGASQVSWLREPPAPASLESMGQRVAQRLEAGLEEVRRDPDSARVWGELGKILEVRSLRELAVTCYEQARLREPDHARWSYRLSVCRWRLGAVQAAMKDIQLAIEQAPEYAPSYYRLGTLHFEEGELDPAQQAFDRCIELDPAFAGGWVGSAKVLLQRDRALEAVALLEPLVARDRSDVVVAALLQSAYHQTGSGKELPPPIERGDYDDGLWNDPWEAELNEYREAPEIHQVLKLLQAGQGAEAARVLERRRAEGRETPDEEELLAEAYFLEGRTEDARAIYLGILERVPSNAAALLALARFAEVEGDLETAVNHLRGAVEVDPNNALAWHTMGRLMHRGERFDVAIPALERALELDQRSSELRLLLGESRLSLQQWAPAAEELERFLEREPESGVGHLLLSKAYLKLRRIEDAEAELTRARQHGHPRRGVEKLVQQGIDKARRRGTQGSGS